MLRRIKIVGVFMSAKNVDGISADAQPRTRDVAIVDCVAHCGVGGARTFSSHVALSREASHQISLCSQCRHNRALRHRLHYRLFTF